MAVRLPSAQKALATLAALGALGAACQEGPSESHPVEAVATVNGEALTAAQVSHALSRARRDNENLTPRTAADQAAFRSAVLDDLISRALFLQAARAAHVTVPNDRIDREILRLRAEYPGPSFDEALAEGGQTQEELHDQIRQRLTVEQYLSSEVLSRVAVTDADVEAYYRTHTAELAHGDEVHAEQIVLDEPETAKRVLAEVKKGERFEELARKYSTAPEARVGGDLGFFAKGQMPEIFDQVCFNLKKGEVSDVITSPYGFHIFKVIDRRPAATPPLAEVRAEIEGRLRKEREEQAQAARLADLRSHADIHIDPQALARLD